MSRRLYVEKKKGFDVEAQGLKKELTENLGIIDIKSVRVVNRYDVSGLPVELYERAKKLVFSEVNLDDISEEEITIPEGAFAFGVEYLPGQFDQRADSAETCIRLLEEGAAPSVRCAKFIVIEGGGLTGDGGEEAREAVLKYCINPVDSCLASFEKPESLEGAVPEPPDVAVLTGFTAKSEAELREFCADMGFAMSAEDLLFVQSYFNDEEKRDPSVTELRVIDTYWSDHCRHTTFLTRLEGVIFEKGGVSGLAEEAFEEYMGLRREVYGVEAARQRPVTLMDMATIGAKYLKKKGLLDDLDESEEINACSIRVKAEIVREEGSAPEVEDWLIMFKNETHNHPTEIEPFGGAATCLGGAIRDPLSGRAYVYQAMRVTGSGDPGIPLKDTPPGKLTQYQITRGAAKGYSSYGNQIGIATGQVDEIYDNSYIAKRLEIGAVVGAAPAKNVVRERPCPGDAILVVGGRTGRDGIGGATGSSKEHTEESVRTAGAEVQKGNPPIERDIQRLFRRKEAASLIKRCNDFGAGGVSVAIGELADGIDVSLDALPKKYEGLDGTELAISESQERMAVVLSPEDVAAFSAFAAEENIEVTHVATVTDTGRFRMYWRGSRILDLSRKFLDTNGVLQSRRAEIKNRGGSDHGDGTFDHGDGDHGDGTFDRRGNIAPVIARSDVSEGEAIHGLKESLLATMSELNVAGKRGLVEHFDSTIGAGTLLMPLGGERQLTPAAGMAAKLPVLSGATHTATLMSYGFDPRISKQSPFHGAIYAILDSCAKIAAMGGDAERIRLTFQEYFPKLGDDPERWALPVTALLGALKAQVALGLPAIGGKDSMSGSFGELDVAPTLVSFALCPADARHILSPEFKKPGSRLVLLECPRGDDLVPDFAAFKNNMKRVHALARDGKLLAASTVSYGGLFAATAKMALGNGVGAALFTTEPTASPASEPETNPGPNCETNPGPNCETTPGTSHETTPGTSHETTPGTSHETTRSAEGHRCALNNLTKERYGSLLLEVDGAEDTALLFAGLPYIVVGETTATAAIEIRQRDASSAQAKQLAATDAIEIRQQDTCQGDDTFDIQGTVTSAIEAPDLEHPIVITLAEIERRWEAPHAATFPVDTGVSASAATDAIEIRQQDTCQGDDTFDIQGTVTAAAVPSSVLRTASATATKIDDDRISAQPRSSFTAQPRRGSIAKPRVFIPVFPGTNCETDSRRAFARAGAEVSLVNLLTTDREKLHGSIKRMAEEIRKSQIVMIPGGFSGGDEPEGSAKFITAVFRNPYMAEAVHDLLENRDGLMLGVCNGFQALIKLGLVPYGRITEPDEEAPTLTYNTIGRHMSRLVRTQVCSALSPWLAGAKPGDIHTLPVSHGEGRFVASKKTLEALADAGQIATRYVDLSGEPADDISANPNGSALSIEGLTSPDGRVFGRMGHSERNVPGLYVNVPGSFDSSIFKSGTDYFK